MSTGSYTVVAPHICGAKIIVQVNWSSYAGSYENPPEHDEERLYHVEGSNAEVICCLKCGVDLDFDDIFQRTVDKLGENIADHGEHEDYPTEPEDLEPPEADWDDVWEKIDPRYN